MKIVIIGDGKVGCRLAKILSEENYDVVLVDNNEARLKESSNKLDVSCIVGDGVSAEVQREAGVPSADLVITCTSTDEVNMLSCLIGKRLGAKHTIARVRNPIYYQQIDLLKEDLHLSMVINPELAVANEIVRGLIFPSASKVEAFVKGKVDMVEVPIKEGNPIVGLSLSEAYHKWQIKILVCAVQRGEDVFIPDGSFVPQPGDKLHIAGAHREMEALFAAFGSKKFHVKKVMIAGGGRTSFYLAKQLCSMGMEVKIVERDYEKCEDLCDSLPKATIINGDATDHELLLEEGLLDADAFVALMGVDEENIIVSLFAKSQGVPKLVAKVNEDSRAKMVGELGIDSVVSGKKATVDVITSYVRARQNSYSSANVEALYHLVDDRVEALEFVIREESEYTGIPLKNLEIKPNNLIACIARKRQMIIPSGEDSFQVGDSVVVITKNKKVQDIQDILQ
ncbi:MAG: Trk system potassium transporter TrkA [Faecalimonas sp.]|nr:Trk system potassium transporter TrkA [Faecalimonas sp.]